MTTGPRTVEQGLPTGHDTLVVVPTLDEVATIEKALSGVLAAGADALVVDDGSRDGTRDVVRRLVTTSPGIHLMDRGERLGLGSAYREGLGWGLAQGYASLGEMDADLSHDPADLVRLRDALRVADLAIGSRYVTGGDVVDWPRRRRWLSRAGNTYVWLWTGLPVRDATAGYRMYRRRVLEAIDLGSIQADGYAFQVEMALRTWLAGYDVLEVPITFTERREGASKMNSSIVREALWRVPRWGLQTRRGSTRTTRA